MPLTEKEIKLLNCVKDGDLGLIRYGVNSLKDDLLLLGGNGHRWNDKAKMWEAKNMATVEHQFFEDTVTELRQLVEAVENLDPEPNDKEFVVKLIGTSIKHCLSATNMTSIWKKIFAGLPTSQELNNYGDQLPLAGGKQISLRTGQIRDRTRADLWSYEIKATGEPGSEQAQADIRAYYSNLCKDHAGVVDMELLEYMQTLAGYWMTFETGDKAVYFLVGISDSGKSDVMDRMRNILGVRVTVCSADVFVHNGSTSNHQTFLAKLDRVSLAYVQELPSGVSLKGDVVKRTSGGDVTNFRVCGQATEQELIPTAKHVVGTNTMMKVDGSDSGLVTRIRKIPLRYNQVKGGTEEERALNRKMLARLKTQDGINATFLWWLEGAKRYYAQIDAGEELRITRPQLVVDESVEFLGDNNSFDHFLTERCDAWVVGSGQPRTSYSYDRNKIQASYKSFCLQIGYSGNQVLSRTQVVDKIKERFPGQKDRGAFVGLREKPQAE